MAAGAAGAETGGRRAAARRGPRWPRGGEHADAAAARRRRTPRAGPRWTTGPGRRAGGEQVADPGRRSRQARRTGRSARHMLPDASARATTVCRCEVVPTIRASEAQVLIAATARTASAALARIDALHTGADPDRARGRRPRPDRRGGGPGPRRRGPGHLDRRPRAGRRTAPTTTGRCCADAGPARPDRPAAGRAGRRGRRAGRRRRGPLAPGRRRRRGPGPAGLRSGPGRRSRPTTCTPSSGRPPWRRC